MTPKLTFHGAATFRPYGEPRRAVLHKRLTDAALDGARILRPDRDESFLLGPAGVVGAAAKARRIAQTAVSQPDWHNIRARLLCDLEDRLRAAPDDAGREALLARLAHDLALAPAGPVAPAIAFEDQP